MCESSDEKKPRLPFSIAVAPTQQDLFDINCYLDILVEANNITIGQALDLETEGLGLCVDTFLGKVFRVTH